METIIIIFLAVFVLLSFYLAFEANKYATRFQKIKDENQDLKTEVGHLQKDVFLWKNKNQVFVPEKDDDVKWLELPYPIVHMELMELRPRFIVRRLGDKWIFALSGASVFIKVITNDPEEGYAERWELNNEIGVEEYKEHLKL